MIPTTHRRPPRLDTVRRRLDRWRRTRAHARAPLPDRLWAAALVPEHGIYGTARALARALGVSYGGLKRHVDARGDTPRERPRARFVELPPASVAGAYVVEIEDAAGRIVRVRLNGVPLSDAAEFTRRVVGVAS